jgi:hypothetical protein
MESQQAKLFILNPVASNMKDMRKGSALWARYIIILFFL